MKRNLQCKDLSTYSILYFMLKFKHEHYSMFSYVEHSIHKCFPNSSRLPNKLILAKLRKLIKRGYIEGCACGCRGDFKLKDQGRLYLKEPWRFYERLESDQVAKFSVMDRRY